jgi:hypothetical protein
MMPIIAFILGLLVAAAKLFAFSKSKVEAKREAICESCVWSLVQKDSNGKKLTFCTFGREVAPVKVVVLECSGFGSRGEEHPEHIAGFITPERGSATVIRIAS